MKSGEMLLNQLSVKLGAGHREQQLYQKSTAKTAGRFQAIMIE